MLSDKLLKISTCQCHGELMQTVELLVKELDIKSFIFILYNKDKNSKKSVRYLIGCDRGWCVEYNKRKWFSTDQFITYSKYSDKPILISDFSAESKGQIDLMNNYLSHGFLSGMVIPSHCVSSDKAGVFIVGNDCAHTKGNIVFLNKVFFLREMSIEILNWFNVASQVSSIDVRQLNELDLKLLKFSLNDENTSLDIAILSDLTVSQVNNRFRKINRIFGVESRRDASNLACQMGIIRLSSS